MNHFVDLAWRIQRHRNALLSENRALRAALRPFMNCVWSKDCTGVAFTQPDTIVQCSVSRRDVERARALLVAPAHPDAGEGGQ